MYVWASGYLGFWASGHLDIWASRFPSVHQSRTTRYIGDKNVVIDKLKSEHNDLKTYLTGLIEFRDTKKAELEERYRNLQNTLEKIQNAHNQTLFTLEQKNAHDRELLKKESINKVNTVAGEFRRISNLQMAETTKRTNTENEAVISQIAKLEEKERELILENEDLKKKFTETNYRLINLESRESLLARKNHCSARLMALLTERTNEVELDLEMTEDKLNDTRLKLNEYNDGSFKPCSVETNLKNLPIENEKLLEDNNNLERILEADKKEFEKLQKIVDRVGFDLSGIILDGRDGFNLSELLRVASENGSESVRESLRFLEDVK